MVADYQGGKHPGRVTHSCRVRLRAAALADFRIKARLTELGGVVLPGSPADYGNLIADEIEKWGEAIKFSGAKPD